MKSTELYKELTQIISVTNGISLGDSIDLILSSDLKQRDLKTYNLFSDFYNLLNRYQSRESDIHDLLAHPVSQGLIEFFKSFPLRYNEEHCHLTGALSADFVYPRLQKLLSGPNKKAYEKKIVEIYGEKALPIDSVEKLSSLISIEEKEGFSQYLKILYLSKIVLTDRKAHEDAAYHMASELYTKYNIGSIRLKFTMSRVTTSEDQVLGSEDISSEDVVLGLFDGFQKFRKLHPDFNFVLSPSFRKEANFFDSKNFATRKDHFMSQVNEILNLLEKYPVLIPHLNEVDTVGDERDLYRKSHFAELQAGFRKLHYRGFKIRSHHGETWRTLKKGIQAVDNAMNIWHIDTLEHGISLGINPNKYFHHIFQKVLVKNRAGEKILPAEPNYQELEEMEWGNSPGIFDKLKNGNILTETDCTLFLKAKFHTAREVEHYQHDVLNRMIQKNVTLVALPSSNKKLTGQFEDYKDHPFSWWEKKNVQLGVGTDNYITLRTNFLEEMVILLLTDPEQLKITKLLMVTTGETKRPHISHLLWKMRKAL